MILNQPFKSFKCSLRSGEAEYTNFIIFGLTWQGIVPMVYHGEHAIYYTTDLMGETDISISKHNNNK
jgi:hypothetical protein